MDPTVQEVRFLTSRSRFVGAWPYVGVVLLLALAGLVGWLFWFAPLLVNPFAVLTRLQGDSIPESTMALSTALLPIAVLACLLLALTIVLLVFAALSNERKYLSIVRKAMGTPE